MSDYDYDDCPPGWYKIVEPLLDHCESENYKVFQIKEKFGGLRFYTNQNDPKLDELLRQAENKAEETCQVCGEPGSSKGSKGWITVLCPEHRAKLNRGEYLYDRVSS